MRIRLIENTSRACRASFIPLALDESNCLSFVLHDRLSYTIVSFAVHVNCNHDENGKNIRDKDIPVEVLIVVIFSQAQTMNKFDHQIDPRNTLCIT